MPTGFPKTGTGGQFKKKARPGMPIQDEGAEPKMPDNRPKSVPALEMKLPSGVQSSKSEVAAAVIRSKSEREIEREHERKMAKVGKFKVAGDGLGQAMSLVGTSGTDVWRERLAREYAGVQLVEGGYFFISRGDRGGHGSAERQPTIWFEAEVVEPDDLPTKEEVIEALSEVADDDEVFTF